MNWDYSDIWNRSPIRAVSALGRGVHVDVMRAIVGPRTWRSALVSRAIAKGGAISRLGAGWGSPRAKFSDFRGKSNGF